MRRPPSRSSRSSAAAKTARIGQSCPIAGGCENPAMASVTARATRAVEAPPDRVLEFLRDYREARPRILTDHYSAYRVEQGGSGEGTVIAYHFAAGGRERDYRLA